MNDCVICNRIPAHEVLRRAHKVFAKYPREKRREIGLEAIQIINDVDKERRTFFCGRPKGALLAGLFYILSLKHDLHVIQFDIAKSFQGASWTRGTLSELSVRNSYRHWLKVFPDKFSLETMTTAMRQNRVWRFQKKGNPLFEVYRKILEMHAEIGDLAQLQAYVRGRLNALGLKETDL